MSHPTTYNYYARSQPPSPVPPAAQIQPYSPPSGGIQPGSITYTTSVGPDGRLIYHPFKAVPASYQNDRGEVIRGIQWVPAEATYVLPEGARPANQDFVQSWGGKLNGQQAKELRDWEKAQLKQIKKEEKRARKANEEARHSQYGWEQISHAEARDADAYGRERRKSVNYGAAQPPYPAQSPSVYAPPPNQGGYPQTMYNAGNEAPPPQAFPGYPSSHGGMSPNPMGDVDRQFGEMSVRERRNSTVARPYSSADVDHPHGSQSRRSSMYGGGVYAAPTTTPARPYSVAQGANIAAPKAVSPYRPPMDLSQGHGPYSSSTAGSEINRAHSPSLINRARTPAAGPPAVYPVGHVMEGQPIPNRALSRATTPNPPGGPMSNVPVPFPVHGQSGGISPNINEKHLRGEQPTEPEAFRRQVNAALPYTNFQPMKIQNMEEFREHIPRMPLVLQPHDVTHEDWYRLMQDLAAAWVGALPTNDPDAARRPSRLVSLLIDQWNAQFFLPRHVEMVLYKGCERRSGPFKGIRDIQIPSYGNSDDDPSSSSSSESSSSAELTSDDEGRYASSYGVYARPDQLTVAREARERRREKKMRKKQKAKEKKARRRQREREKTYAIYLRSVPRQQPAPAGTNAAIPSYATSPSISPSFPTIPTGGYASSTGSAGYPQASAGPYSSSSVNARAGSGHMGYGGPGAGYPNTGYGGSPSGYAPPPGYASSGGY